MDMNDTGFKKRLAVFLSFALAVCMLGGFAPISVYGKEKRTVKVAFFPMNGYNVKEPDGTYSGMDVEYLDELCRYADWEIQYVDCGSWDAALELLKDKKVDLVGTAQYSPQRASIYDYAELPSGYTFGIIATTPDSSLAYEDFEAMKSVTFGMVKTYVRRDEFLQYLADNGVRAPKIREYDSTAQLLEALETGQIDAMVHTFMEIKEGQRLIGRFAPRPFYYITYSGNEDVLRELNYAIADLKMNAPELETKLMNKFYQSRLDKTIVFTTAEKNYIAQAGHIVVGYLDGYYPFLYEEDGECKGLTRDLMEGAAAVAGLTLSWQKMDSESQAGQALADKTIDIMSYSVDKEDADQPGLTRMKDYTQIPLVLLMKENRELSSMETLATVSYLAADAAEMVNLENLSLVTYDTQQQCMDAVKDKKADAALCDGYLAEYLLSSQMRYYDLEVRSVLNGEHGIAMTLRSDDQHLAGILNKTILTIDAKAANDYMLEHNIHSMTSMAQFIQDHSSAIILILLCAIAAVILVAFHIVRDSRKIQNLMYKDVETDIWNLNHLLFWGKQALNTDRSKSRYAIAYVNISQFQRYKVVYGWSNGQKLLKAMADSFSRSIISREEVYAKADGDHFVLMLCADNNDTLSRLKNMVASTEDRILQCTGNRIELQVGVYYIPKGSDDLRGAIVCASQAIDFIHENSAQRIMVYDESLEKAIMERHDRENLLDSVDIDGNFATYYQAKTDVNTEQIVGAEALVRFLDPTAQGAVRSPSFFVPYYEETGKVMDIDFFVLRCVCRMLRKRLDLGLSVVTISCNFSRLHFIKDGFVQQFEDVLDQYGIPRELIEVEITETLVMEELQEKIAKQTLDDLHARGIRLSIDDFGSGYSSLGVIEKIPASVIKLDRSFLLNQKDRDRQVKIMKSIVDLASELGAQIVCEGVETDADVELMREIGACVAQGYRYAKPVPEEEFEKKLAGAAANF